MEKVAMGFLAVTGYMLIGAAIPAGIFFEFLVHR